MIERYAEHRPTPELAVHLGLDEEEPPAVAGSDLVWLGRIDEEKAPHIAVRAAQILGRPIQIVGPVFDEAYVRRHERLFSASHVKWAGELGGSAKTAAIRDASVFVYTYARTYVEAGAAVFGESLRAGTPMAALTWREGTCAEAALCDQTGAITVADPDVDDETAAGLLAGRSKKPRPSTTRTSRRSGCNASTLPATSRRCRPGHADGPGWGMRSWSHFHGRAVYPPYCGKYLEGNGSSQPLPTGSRSSTHAEVLRIARLAAPRRGELLAVVKAGFAAQGVPQAACLPLRWGRETELTISAVQALDPSSRTAAHGHTAAASCPSPSSASPGGVTHRVTFRTAF
ncbi:hypothetical protein NKH18_27505 [Streptomyces sp. M10(2022)]